MKKTILWLLLLSLLLSIFLLAACGKQQNPLVGTWTLRTVNGNDNSNEVGKKCTFSESGKLYDTDDLLSYYLNDEYPLVGWESANGTLYFSGSWGDSCQADYSLNGKTLTIHDRYHTLVFAKS